MTPELTKQTRDNYFEKSMPTALEAERASIGATMIEASAVEQIRNLLKIEDYSQPLNRTVLKGVFACADAGKTIDPINIADALTRQGVSIETLGGVAGIADFMRGVPFFNDITAWLEKIKDKSVLRRIIKFCLLVIDMAKGQEYSPDELLAYIEKEIYDLRDEVQTKEKVEYNGIYESAKEIHRQIQDNYKNKRPVGLMSGLRELDKVTGGCKKADLIITGARPSMGKSALMLRRVLGIVDNQPEAVATVFSNEMGKDLCIARLICQKAKVNLQNYLAGEYLTHEDWRKVGEAIAWMEDKRIEIIDEVGITPIRQRYHLNRIADKYGQLDFVCADYVELMDDDVQHAEERHRLGAIAKQCKFIAKEYKVPYNLLSQLSRKVEARNPPIPIMSDLAESGKLEAHADVVEFIYREEYYKPTEQNKGVADIIYAKNRNGGTPRRKMAWIGNATTFENLYE